MCDPVGRLWLHGRGGQWVTAWMLLTDLTMWRSGKRISHLIESISNPRNVKVEVGPATLEGDTGKPNFVHTEIAVWSAVPHSWESGGPRNKKSSSAMQCPGDPICHCWEDFRGGAQAKRQARIHQDSSLPFHCPAGVGQEDALGPCDTHFSGPALLAQLLFQVVLVTSQPGQQSCMSASRTRCRCCCWCCNPRG